MNVTNILRNLRSGITFLLRGEGYRISRIAETERAFDPDIFEVVHLSTGKEAVISYEEIIGAANDGEFEIPNFESVVLADQLKAVADQSKVAVQDLLAELRIPPATLKLMAKGYSPDYPGMALPESYCKIQLSAVVATKLIEALGEDG